MQQEELYPIYEKGVGELIEDRRKIKEKKRFIVPSDTA